MTVLAHTVRYVELLRRERVYSHGGLTERGTGGHPARARRPVKDPASGSREARTPPQPPRSVRPRKAAS